MDKVAALCELHSVSTCTRIEFKNMRAARHMSQQMRIDFVPHPSQMRVIFGEGVILLCRTRKGFGDRIQRRLRHRSSWGVGVAASSCDMCGKEAKAACGFEA